MAPPPGNNVIPEPGQDRVKIENLVLKNKLMTQVDLETFGLPLIDFWKRKFWSFTDGFFEIENLYSKISWLMT